MLNVLTFNLPSLGTVIGLVSLATLSTDSPTTVPVSDKPSALDSTNTDMDMPRGPGAAASLLNETSSATARSLDESVIITTVSACVAGKVGLFATGPLSASSPTPSIPISNPGPVAPTSSSSPVTSSLFMPTSAAVPADGTNAPFFAHVHQEDG
ncbi:hypothetical protein AAF712_015505 [Marasmius tenuissimus]|uniref:Secreted protein n=1 Tax=Marasmius tenuissimus TaxID=585030 RepID=A0ABR2Z832_9AGAR